MNKTPLSPVRGAIVAMTRDNVIGLDGSIPWHHSADLKRFKRTTMDATIVMGRLTWESLNCNTLPGRRNVVVSRNPVENVESYTSVEEALKACDSDTWIIGGGQIYSASLHWVNLLDVTYVPEVINHEEAVCFPTIDPDIWEQVSSTKLEDSSLLNVIYRRR
jgi:dihydrofolate reductase